MIVTRRFNVELVSLLSVRIYLVHESMRSTHDYGVKHAENLGLQYRDKVFRVYEFGIQLFDIAKLEANLPT